MTYSSRNFLISWGTGREVRAPPRDSNRLSSAMMSFQTSTHSCQMNTPGAPAGFGPVVGRDDVVADLDTLVADEHGGTRDQLADIVLVLVTERAAENLAFAGLFDHEPKPYALFRMTSS